MHKLLACAPSCLQQHAGMFHSIYTTGMLAQLYYKYRLKFRIALQTIEQWGRWHKGQPSCQDPHMLKAQAILRRLRNREIYKYCNEVLVPQCELECAPQSQCSAAIY